MFWRKDKTRERGHDVLRHVRHVRRMREDIMPAAELTALRGHEAALAAALRAGQGSAIAEATRGAETWFDRHAPRRAMSGLREHLEILAVAVGVAMACRTYFIQPFKIPTGSMQPTLYGIIYRPADDATLMDRLPLKVGKWFWSGAWFQETRIREAGQARSIQALTAGDGTQRIDVRIGGAKGITRYRLPTAAIQRLEQAGIVARWEPVPGVAPPGPVFVMPDASSAVWYTLDTQRWLPRGTVLWRGERIAGDHVFVDRVRWNFFPPKRGQIVVFGTDTIPTLLPNQHYIKRLVGLPGETISIDPPNLLVNGKPATGAPGIERIQNRAPGYAGYALVDPRTPAETGFEMRRTEDSIRLNDRQLFALGDNTGNSKDGRYWGAVPRDNLVGPAALVYWPFSNRWGVPK